MLSRLLRHVQCCLLSKLCVPHFFVSRSFLCHISAVFPCLTCEHLRCDTYQNIFHCVLSLCVCVLSLCALTVCLCPTLFTATPCCRYCQCLLSRLPCHLKCCLPSIVKVFVSYRVQVQVPHFCCVTQMPHMMPDSCSLLQVLPGSGAHESGTPIRYGSAIKLYSRKFRVQINIAKPVSPAVYFSKSRAIDSHLE